MVTMGSDFQYQAAHNWFKNLDKLIAYVNQKVKTNNMLHSKGLHGNWQTVSQRSA